MHRLHLRQYSNVKNKNYGVSFGEGMFPFLSCRAAQIELLHALAAISLEHNLGEGISVKIKFNIIASLYDYNPNLAAFMKVRHRPRT